MVCANRLLSSGLEHLCIDYTCVYDRRYQVDECGAYGTDTASEQPNGSEGYKRTFFSYGRYKRDRIVTRS
jgi:hypothetical protein